METDFGLAPSSWHNTGLAVGPLLPKGVTSFPLPDGMLLVRSHGDSHLPDTDEDTLVEWCLLDEIGSSGGNRAYEILCKGHGYAGALREPRHTQFANKGYVFYINPHLLADAFKVLEKWFDFE